MAIPVQEAARSNPALSLQALPPETSATPAASLSSRCMMTTTTMTMAMTLGLVPSQDHMITLARHFQTIKLIMQISLPGVDRPRPRRSPTFATHSCAKYAAEPSPPPTWTVVCVATSLRFRVRTHGTTPSNLVLTAPRIPSSSNYSVCNMNQYIK